MPRLEVFNKIDLLEIEPRIDRDDSGCAIRVWLSAREGIGLDLLKQAMDEHLAEEQFVGTLHLKPEQANCARSYLPCAPLHTSSSMKMAAKHSPFVSHKKIGSVY